MELRIQNIKHHELTILSSSEDEDQHLKGSLEELLKTVQISSL